MIAYIATAIVEVKSPLIFYRFQRELPAQAAVSDHNTWVNFHVHIFQLEDNVIMLKTGVSLKLKGRNIKHFLGGSAPKVTVLSAPPLTAGTTASFQELY